MIDTFPVRVAMIIQAYYPRLGGAERQLASLAPLLKNLGVEIQIFTRKYDRVLAPFEIINNVPVYRLPVPGPKPLAALSYSISAMPMLAKLKPDVIHAHELLSPATTALMAKWLFRTPVVAKVLRGGELGDLAKLKNRAFGGSRIESIKKGIDSFVVISTEIDNELEAIGVPKEKRIFIPNGVDPDRFAPGDKSDLRHSLNLPDDVIVVYSGRLDPEKRVIHLVEIWKEVIKKHPAATLLILGAGTEGEALKQLAGAKVRFEGNVRDVAPYLRAADIFVLPSSTEGLSNALLEAMASGLAPIVTSVGGATDLIRDGENGILIPPDNQQAILSSLLILLDNIELRMRFGVTGRKLVEKNYSLSASAEKLNALYRQLWKPSLPDK